MNKVFTRSLVCMVFALVAFKSDKPAYLLYNSKGKNIKYEQMINELANADVVFFGEYHNNPISHWLEYEVTKSLHQMKKGNIIMGAEMFETDNQLILDEYLMDQISMGKFEEECRLWGNYSTDYDPLVTLAKDSSIHLVATNIPRRYADIVHKKGLEQLNELSSTAKDFFAPLPIEIEPDSILKDQLGIMSALSKNPVNVAKAQAIKDATMAYFISKNLKKDQLFIHYNGSFHSDGKEGIIKYLNRYKKGLKIKNITTVQQEDISRLDSTYHDQADYVICVTESMTRTY
ncbi:iron-regulated protein [Puteibacter caeruleilacunae]|nr:iron-regulated protein [Puteibacter caeruleilacunae]